MIDIIAATPHDLPLIRKLAEQIFHITYLPLQPKDKVDYLFDLMYSPTSLAKQMSEGQKFIIAKEETEHLGFASYEINCKKPSVTKIHKLYVLANAQGKGVGKKLVDAIAGIATQSNNQVLSLNVYRQNPVIDFYEKLGFKKVNDVDIDVGNGFTMNDFVMEKRL
jgi:ribosomal protein S18 acetylase RimI-like enzyme